MTKAEFLSDLSRRLEPLDASERARFVGYYDEMLSDRIEDGMTDDEAIASLEPISVIAGRILSEAAPVKREPRRREVGKYVLIVLGSPLWLPILAACAVVVLAFLIVVWTAWLMLALCCVILPIAGAATLIAGIVQLLNMPASGLYLMGSGLFAAALGILAMRPTRWLFEHGVRFMRTMGRWATGRLKKGVV